MRIGLAFVALLGSAQSYANCGDISQAFFGVEMDGRRSYMAAMPEGFRVETFLYPGDNAGGWDTLWGESHGISHAASLTWGSDERVFRIRDMVLTSSVNTLERHLKIVGDIAGVQFEHNPSTNNYTLACEPDIWVLACEEEFPATPRPHMNLVIEYAAVPNVARDEAPFCQQVSPDAVPERGPIYELPLSSEEIERELEYLRERLERSDPDDEFIAESLANARAYYDETPVGYRTNDRLALFPEITESDELAHFCSARFVSPPQHYIYVAFRTGDDNAVDVKTIGCRTSEGEMYCALSVDDAITLGEPEDFFFYDESIDEAEARTVASLYLEQTGYWNNLNRISKQGDEYTLQFGRRGCACSETRHARIVYAAGERSLELDEITMITCS